MSVDFSISDYTLDEDLIVCGAKYAEAFEYLVDDLLPQDRNLLAFHVMRSAYGGHDDRPVEPEALPLAGDMESEFEELAALARLLEADRTTKHNDNEAHALKVFSSEALAGCAEHCRNNIRNRILVSMW